MAQDSTLPVSTTTSPLYKIALYGGSFNPIHNGHLKTARYVLDSLKLNELYLLPNANPPHKSTVKLPFTTRVAMLKAALQDEADARLKISLLEEDSSKPHYTFNTLSELHAALKQGFSPAQALAEATSPHPNEATAVTTAAATLTTSAVATTSTVTTPSAVITTSAVATTSTVATPSTVTPANSVTREHRETGESASPSSIAATKGVPLSYELYFIMGMDSLVSLPSWYRGLELINLAHIVVLMRPGFDLTTIAPEIQAKIAPPLDSTSPYRYILLDNPPYAMSSTEIRQSLHANDSATLAHMLSPRTLNYIREHHLYS